MTNAVWQRYRANFNEVKARSFQSRACVKVISTLNPACQKKKEVHAQQPFVEKECKLIGREGVGEGGGDAALGKY